MILTDDFSSHLTRGSLQLQATMLHYHHVCLTTVAASIHQLFVG